MPPVLKLKSIKYNILCCHYKQREYIQLIVIVWIL